MPVARLLAIALVASAAIASAQSQKQSGLAADPAVNAVNSDAGKPPEQAEREQWQIIPDPKLEPLFPLSPQIHAGSKPGHRLTYEEGFRLFMNASRFQLPRITLLPDGEYTTDSICYSIRSYVVERDDKDSDSTHPVGSSTCRPASRYGGEEGAGRAGPADR